MGINLNTDGIDQVGAMFQAYGRPLSDSEGNIQVKSDKVKQFLELAQKWVKLYPIEAVSHDDASNNRVLISGKIRADLQSALSLGGCQARCAQCGKELLELLLPGWVGVRTGAHLLLRCVGL